MIDVNIPLLIAQLVTFLIATFIFWKFFWKNIVQMLESRKEMIAKDISSANQLREEAQSIEKELSEKIFSMKTQEKDIIETAKHRGRAERDEILKQAHKDAKDVLENARKEIEYEKALAIAELRAETVALSVSIAEKVLKRSIDPSVQDDIIADFAENSKLN
jgi:F-type H+-transporting ATPase subunit b